MNWIISWQHLPPNREGSTAGPLGKLSLGNGKTVQVRTIARSRTEMQLLFQPAVLLECQQLPVSSIPMISMCLGLFLLEPLTCCPLGVQWTALLQKVSTLPRPLSCPSRPRDSALHPRGCDDIQCPWGPAACPWCPPQSPGWCCPRVCDWPQVCVSALRVAITSLPVKPAVLNQDCPEGQDNTTSGPSPAWPTAPLAGWPSQGHTVRQGDSGSTCRGPVPTCVRSQLRFLPSRPRGTVLPDGSPSAPCRSVLDHHQSALPKSAFSEEAIDPPSLEEQAEESRQVSDGQGCVYTSGASCGHGYTWIYIFSCVFT